MVMPLLTASLTLYNYGLFAIYLLLINLFSPIITANLSAGILREGLVSSHRGFKLQQIVWFYSIALVAICVILNQLIQVDDTYVYVGILIIMAGHQECLVSYYRANYRDGMYLLLAITRALSLTVPAALSFYQLLDFKGLVAAYCFGMVVSSLITTPLNMWVTPITYRTYVHLRSTFWYCVYLIPYAVGQWVVSSSTRVLLGSFDSVENAGLFAIAYTLSSPIILVFSICGVVFARSILAMPNKWIDEAEFRHKMILGLVIVASLATFSSMAIILLDYQTFKLIKYYSQDIVLITGGISMSLLFQCLYSIYGNFLFYKKATKTLARNSLIIAGLHVIHSYILISMFSLVGAVISISISYWLIYLSSFRSSKQVLDHEMAGEKRDVIYILAGLTAQIIMIWYFHLEWNAIYIP